MISAGEFRNGKTFELDGEIYVIIEFQHVKPGKGAAFVRTKIKNLKTRLVAFSHRIHPHLHLLRIFNEILSSS